MEKSEIRIQNIESFIPGTGDIPQSGDILTLYGCRNSHKMGQKDIWSYVPCSSCGYEGECEDCGGELVLRVGVIDLVSIHIINKKNKKQILQHTTACNEFNPSPF